MSATREAGWYHLKGDPPGTTRRWNGYEWIGSPIDAPSEPEAQLGAIAVKFYRLSGVARISGWLAAVSMTALAAVFLIGTARFFGAAERLRLDDPRVGVIERLQVDEPVVHFRDLTQLLDGLVVPAAIAAVLMFIGGVTFSYWLISAGKATGVRPKRTYSNRQRVLGLLCVLLLVAVILVRNLALTLAVVVAPVLALRTVVRRRQGTRPTRSRRTIILSTVLGLAAVSSTDPRTGIVQLSPKKIKAWWLLWWGPLIAGLFGGYAIASAGSVELTTMTSAFQAAGILLVLQAISALLIASTIVQVTRRLS